MIKARIRELQPDEPVADVEAISFMLGGVPTGTLHRWASLDGWPRRHTTTRRGRRTEYSITAAKATYERQRLDTGGGSTFVSDQASRILEAITAKEQIYTLDPPEDDFDFQIPKDEELHTLICAKYMTGQNAECTCTTPADVRRRCEADRLTVSFCKETLNIGTSAAAQTLARLVLTNLAQSYGVHITPDTPPKTDA